MRRGGRVLTNAIQTDGLTAEELAFAVFLQGALNRRQKSMFLDIDRYADYLLKKPVYTDLWALAENSASLFDGMAVYDLLPGDVSVNLAATACAAENWLGVPRPLAEKVSGYGLKCVFDTAEIKGNEVERQRSVWLRFRDKLKKNCLVHQVTAEGGGRYGLRDYAIAAGAFTFFARPDRDSAFLREVLGWADKGIPVYGWDLSGNCPFSGIISCRATGPATTAILRESVLCGWGRKAGRRRPRPIRQSIIWRLSSATETMCSGWNAVLRGKACTGSGSGVRAIIK